MILSSPPAKAISWQTSRAVAFEHLGLELKEYLVVDQNLFRPTEIMIGRGNASKAASKLGWSPRYKMEDVARMIVDACNIEFGLESDESGVLELNSATGRRKVRAL